MPPRIIYSSSMSLRPKARLAPWAKSSHSRSVNGTSFTRRVSLPRRPPLSFRSFLLIHEVALPQTINTISFSRRAVAQPFQKLSKAPIRFPLGVSIHGSSSMKSTFFPAGALLMNCFSNSKASIQLFGMLHLAMPAAIREFRKAVSCWRSVPLATPVCWKQNW